MNSAILGIHLDGLFFFLIFEGIVFAQFNLHKVYERKSVSFMERHAGENHLFPWDKADRDRACAMLSRIDSNRQKKPFSGSVCTSAYSDTHHVKLGSILS
jgi:hypothetical protein